MAVTKDTDWRHLGSVPLATWQKLIKQAGGSPGFADPRVHAAYGDDSALALAQSEAESSYASNYRKIKESFRDPLNLQIDGAGVDFSKGGSVSPVDAYVAGAREWKRRLYSADYKNGVYTKTKSIYEMVSQFAPESDGNDPLTYSEEVAAHINKYGTTEVETPSTPEEPVTTWREQLNTMFGAGKWSLTQDWGNDPSGAVYDDMYSYGVGHGTNGQTHPGMDIGVPYGTKMYAVADATVICGGTDNGPGFHNEGCGAFNDWGDQCEVLTSKKGVGRIELLFGNGQSLIYGHSRTSLVKPGDKVVRGQQIGTSGGMCGAHCHIEARRWENGTYLLFDPKTLLESLPTTSTPVEPAEPGVPVVTVEILNRVIGVQGNAPATKLNVGPNELQPIVHNTDNKSNGADALMHATFVKNGGGSGNVSFHFANDSKRAVQILPLDRIGYHASDGCDSRTQDEGCFWGIAIENCDNADGDINKTFDNLAELLACIEFGDDRIDYGTMPKAYFKGFIDRTLGHQDVSFDHKYCPSDFLNLYGAAWKSKLITLAKKKLAAKQGSTTPVDPVYVDPEPMAAGTYVKNDRLFLEVNKEYTTTKATKPYKYADFKPTQQTGPEIPKGTKVRVLHVVSDTGATSDLTLVIDALKVGDYQIKAGSRIDGKAVAS